MMRSPRSMQTVLDSLVRLIAEHAARQPGGGAPREARLAVFPKRVHELSPDEGLAPDGLSTAYVALAARLNAGVPPSSDLSDPVGALLRLVEREVAEATVNERRLIDFLNKPKR